MSARRFQIHPQGTFAMIIDVAGPKTAGYPGFLVAESVSPHLARIMVDALNDGGNPYAAAGIPDAPVVYAAHGRDGSLWWSGSHADAEKFARFNGTKVISAMNVGEYDPEAPAPSGREAARGLDPR